MLNGGMQTLLLFRDQPNYRLSQHLSSIIDNCQAQTEKLNFSFNLSWTLDIGQFNSYPMDTFIHLTLVTLETSKSFKGYFQLQKQL